MKKFLLCTLLICTQINAMEVIDNANLVEMGIHLQQLKDQFEVLKIQRDKLIEQYNAMTGENDFSSIFTPETDDFWSWTPSVEDLNEMALGNYQTGSLNDRVKFYNDKYGEGKKPEDYVPHDPDSYSGQVQSDQSMAVRTGLGVSDEVMKRVKEFEEEIYPDQQTGLAKQMDQKDSIDYGNNIQLQMAALMNQILKVQAEQLKLLALTNADKDMNNDFNSKFFNTDFYTGDKS